MCALRYLSALEELLLSGGHVLGLTLPGGQHARLERTSVAERQRPRLLDARELVDHVEVDRGLLLGLTARQEGHARHGRRHGARQRRDGGARDLERRVLGARVLEAGRAHVGLE